MILGLRTAVYSVTDLAQAKAWYSKVLEKEPYFSEPYYVGFEVGGFELGLIPDGKPGVEGATVYWGVADIGAELHRIQQLGAPIADPAHEVGGGIYVATLADPFGNLFGLIQNPHFAVEKVR